MADKTNPVPPNTPKDGKGRGDAPDSGEIEWAGGFIANPPAPGEVRVDPDDVEEPPE